MNNRDEISESIADVIQSTYELEKQISMLVKHHGKTLKDKNVYWHPEAVRRGIANVRATFQDMHYDLWVERKAGEMR